MAITAAKKLSDFNGFIKPELAGPIFDEAAKGSAAMSLIRKVPLGASGQAFPIVTSKPTANWTAEGAQKHTTEAGLGLVKMEPKKLTAIAVASQEVIRANPGGYSETLAGLLADAFARAFDLAVFHNKGGDGNGTSPFETTLAATTKSVTLGAAAGANTYDDLVKAMSLNLQGTPKKQVTGFAFDTGFEIDLLSAKDTAGRPLFAEAAYTGAVPALWLCPRSHHVHARKRGPGQDGRLRGRLDQGRMGHGRRHHDGHFDRGDGHHWWPARLPVREQPRRRARGGRVRLRARRQGCVRQDQPQVTDIGHLPSPAGDHVAAPAGQPTTDDD